MSQSGRRRRSLPEVGAAARGRIGVGGRGGDPCPGFKRRPWSVAEREAEVLGVFARGRSWRRRRTNGGGVGGKVVGKATRGGWRQEGGEFQPPGGVISIAHENLKIFTPFLVM